MKTLLEAEIAMTHRKPEDEIRRDILDEAIKLIVNDHIYYGSVAEMTDFMWKELIREYADALDDPDFTEEDLKVENFYEMVSSYCAAEFG